MAAESGIPSGFLLRLVSCSAGRFCMEWTGFCPPARWAGNGAGRGIHTGWQRSVCWCWPLPSTTSQRGCSFWCSRSQLPSASLAAAVALALGIGLQNFPGARPCRSPRREGFSRLRSFWYGQLSGMVEPLAGLAGAAAVLLIRPILPYALAFAAGAMIYVVVEELIPESQLSKNSDISTLGALLGFAVMMTLDVALG